MRQIFCRDERARDNDLSILLFLGRRLKSLKLGNMDIEDPCIITIANNCPCLELVSLFHMNLITDAAIVSLSGCCSQLKTLNLCVIPNLMVKT